MGSKFVYWLARAECAVLAVMAVAFLGVSGAAAPSAMADDPQAAGAATTEVTLRKGDRGRAVRALQRRLRISADGVFGSQTARAVRRYQRRKGLVADGIVGPITRRSHGAAPLRARQRAPSAPGLSWGPGERARRSCGASPNVSPGATPGPSRATGATAASTSSCAPRGAAWAAAAIRPTRPSPSRIGSR